MEELTVFSNISSNLPGVSPPEVSRGHSSRGNEPGAGRCPLKHETGGLPALRSGHAARLRSKWSRDRGPGIQPMKDRTNEEGIDPATGGRTDDARRRGQSECQRGGKHGAPQAPTMIEEILHPDNLAAAWQRVKANQGAPGIDGMTVADFCPRSARAMRSVVSSSGNLVGKGRHAGHGIPRSRGGTGRGFPKRSNKEPISPRPCAGCSFPSPTGRNAR